MGLIVVVTHFTTEATSTRMDIEAGVPTIIATEGGDGRNFCDYSNVCYFINFCGTKKSDGEIKLMLMEIYCISSYAEGCAAAISVVNKARLIVGCGKNNGSGGGLRSIFC